MSLACFGCARLPSEMGDGREKHPVVPDLPRAEDTDDVLVRRELPGEPWRLEAAHAGTQGGEAAAEESEDGGVMQQRDREAAERAGPARRAVGRRVLGAGG